MKRNWIKKYSRDYPTNLGLWSDHFSNHVNKSVRQNERKIRILNNLKSYEHILDSIEYRLIKRWKILYIKGDLW